MFQSFHDGVEARLQANAKPGATEWIAIIAALLPVVLSLFENCQKKTVEAVNSGNVGPLQRLQLVRAIRRESSLNLRESSKLAEAMVDEAVEQQVTPRATQGKTWIELVAEEING